MNTAIDSILDMNLEDLADMPAFFVPPNGAYSATILSMASKKIGDHPAVEVNFRIDAVLELADTAATPPPVGTETSTSYMTDNEYGVGALKELLKPLGSATGASNVASIMAAAKGMQVMIVTKNRWSKDKTTEYLGINSISVM